MSLYFHKFHEFCSVAKLNFAKVSPSHTFYAAPCGSFMKIFFTKLLKLPFLQKFSDVKISRYTVGCGNEATIANRRALDTVASSSILHCLKDLLS